MKLYKFKEKTGNRMALAIEQDPDDLPSGAWEAIGTIEVNKGDGPRIGADSDEILDAVEREGLFVLPRFDA